MIKWGHPACGMRASEFWAGNAAASESRDVDLREQSYTCNYM